MAQGADGARRAEDQLAGLRERLIEEYGTRVPTDAIDRAARQSLGEFEDARIRDFVGVFAWRRARRRLADRTLP
jgi:hypothetical protein